MVGQVIEIQHQVSELSGILKATRKEKQDLVVELDEAARKFGVSESLVRAERKGDALCLFTCLSVYCLTLCLFMFACCLTLCLFTWYDEIKGGQDQDLFSCSFSDSLSLHLFAWKRQTGKHEETEGEAIDRERGDRAGTEVCSFHSWHIPWQAAENAQLRTASCEMATRLQQLTEDLARSEEQLSGALALQTEKDTQVEPALGSYTLLPALRVSSYSLPFISLYTQFHSE